MSPKSSEISIQFTEGVSAPYSSYADGDTVVVTEGNTTNPTGGVAPHRAPHHAPHHAPNHAPNHAHPPQRGPNGDIYARPTRLRIASQV